MAAFRGRPPELGNARDLARRVGAHGVLLLLIGVWALALSEGGDLPIQAHGLGTTCDPVADFERLAPRLADSSRVVLVAADARVVFCAQRDLAPVPIESWAAETLHLRGGELERTAILVHLDDPAAVEAAVATLLAAAARRGLPAAASRLGPRLAVVRIGGIPA